MPERFTNGSSKLPYHPDSVDKLLRNEAIIPISMEVDLTYFCGDGCNFCHFAYTHEGKLKTEDGRWDTSKVMTPEIARIVFKKLADGGVKSVVFSGGGEPLDSPFALEIFQIAKSSGLELGMYTRGFGLRGEISDFIAENFEWVVVSLDVSNGEDHEKVKGTSKKVFDRKVQNVKDFVSRPNRHADISISCMVGPQHLEMVEPYDNQKNIFNETKITRLERDMIWMLSLGTDEVHMRPIVDTGTYKEQKIDHKMHGMAFKSNEGPWENHYSHLPQIVEVLKKYTDTPRLNISIDKFEDLYQGLSGYETCDAMRLSAGLVRTDGIVDKCVNNRKIAPIGNLITQSVTDIYLDPNLDTKVDGSCRAGCRGCKVNTAMHKLKGGSQLPPPNPNVKHPNFI